MPASHLRLERSSIMCVAPGFLARLITAAAVALSTVIAVPAHAQEPPAQPPAQQERRDPIPEPRPYDRVITKDARSDDGIFTVHRLGDRLYYEIPKSAL